MNTALTTGILAFLFLCKMALGYITARSGKPYAALPLAFHKLLSVAAGILGGILIAGFVKKGGMDAPETAAIATSAALFLAAFVTGALQSALKDTVPAVLILHRITPYLALASAGAAVWLFLRK